MIFLNALLFEYLGMDQCYDSCESLPYLGCPLILPVFRFLELLNIVQIPESILFSLLIVENCTLVGN